MHEQVHEVSVGLSGDGLACMDDLVVRALHEILLQLDGVLDVHVLLRL